MLIFSKYSEMGASSRLRSFQYVNYFTLNGMQPTVHSFFDDRYLTRLYQKKSSGLLSITKYYMLRIRNLSSSRDTAFIEYELLPYVPYFIEKVFSASLKYKIVDYDDAIFHNYDLSTNVLVRKLLGKKINKVMASADVVIVGSGYLKERALKSGAKRVEFIPTVVDKDRYSPKIHSDKSVINIGWIGSPSTVRYIHNILPILEKLARQYSIQLIIVGAEVSIDLLTSSSLDIKCFPWSEDEECNLVQSFDIGIMPLDDGPWERGKCGYKLVQYMASGVPFVASRVGANIDISERSSAGFLAEDEEEWVSALSSLCASTSLRQELGNNGRSAVESFYCTQVQGPRLVEIIRSVSEPK